MCRTGERRRWVRRVHTRIIILKPCKTRNYDEMRLTRMRWNTQRTRVINICDISCNIYTANAELHSCAHIFSTLKYYIVYTPRCIVLARVWSCPDGWKQRFPMTGVSSGTGIRRTFPYLFPHFKPPPPDREPGIRQIRWKRAHTRTERFFCSIHVTILLPECRVIHLCAQKVDTEVLNAGEGGQYIYIN